ncbi:MAG: hypothetical protein LBD11_05560 [Candidatus Peribacteria bacterium]|nr:hypothetical protein [Candidatus Peribacteria bacterium]
MGVINAEEAKTISREKLSEKRRDLLANSGITPIEMHSPLRFRSRNNFQFDLTNSK